MPKGVYQHKKGFVRKPLSEEHKKKLSLAHSGKKLSEEHKQKIKEANKDQMPSFRGRKHSEKTKKKMRESHKGHLGWNKGIKLSEEHKKKISIALKGKPNKGAFKKGHKNSEETKKKIGAAFKGKKLTEIHRENLSLSRLGALNPSWKGGIHQDKKHRNQVYYKWLSKNPQRKIDNHMASFINLSLKGKKAGRKWSSLVGYTINDLMTHLQKQFDDKMNWNNHGNYWHIDHIKPRSLFKYGTAEDEEFKKCWALGNLQPLEKITNIKKSNKWEESKESVTS